jgi:hypothetical protein
MTSQELGLLTACSYDRLSALTVAQLAARGSFEFGQHLIFSLCRAFGQPTEVEPCLLMNGIRLQERAPNVQ